MYGGLREPGNILAARVVTVEETPRVIELRGDAAQKVNRAYGTTGIITALEMPLAPAWPWIDVVVAFDDFHEPCRSATRSRCADGIDQEAAVADHLADPRLFRRSSRPFAREGKSLLVAMIAEPSLEVFKAIARRARHDHPARRRRTRARQSAALRVHLEPHHAAVLKVDRTVTYLQCLYPHDRMLASRCARWPRCSPTRCCRTWSSSASAAGSPAARCRSCATRRPSGSTRSSRLHEAHGVFIANPHVVTLEDGSRHKRADADQLGFKHEVDPHGLLNPGKMRTFVARADAGARELRR